MLAGDIGAKFAWDTKAFGKHFSIQPSEGFLSPGQDAKLVVTMDPQEASIDMRIDNVACRIEGVKEPLLLTLTGAAINDGQVCCV